MESKLRNNKLGIKVGLASVVAPLVFYSTFTIDSYYKCNQALESMSPTSRADKAYEYVESWEKAPSIIKYSPQEIGMYFSAKKYAMENPLKKKGIRT